MTRVLLSAAARAVLGGGHGSLTDQIELTMAHRPLDQRHSFRRLGQPLSPSAANRLMG